MNGMRSPRSAISARLAFAAIVASLSLSGAPPVRAEGDLDAIRSAFERFADGWMARRPSGEIGSGEAAPRTATSRGGAVHRVSRAYQTEVRSTGHGDVPYIGVLRYTRLTYHCPPGRAKGCRLVKRTPVKEYFPFTGGAWQH